MNAIPLCQIANGSHLFIMVIINLFVSQSTFNWARSSHREAVAKPDSGKPRT